MALPINPLTASFFRCPAGVAAATRRHLVGKTVLYSPWPVFAWTGLNLAIWAEFMRDTPEVQQAVLATRREEVKRRLII